MDKIKIKLFSILKKIKDLKHKNIKLFTILLLIILIIVLVLLGLFGPKGENQQSTVSLLKVGNGNCMVIQSGDDIYLYNAGSDKENETAIEDYLESKKIKHVNGLILANNKKNNINRAKKIINIYKIKKVYMSSFGDNNSSYLSLLDFLDKNKNIKVDYPNMNDEISLVHGSIKFIQSNNKYETLEDASLCIEYKDDRMLNVYAMGDVTPIAEKDIIKNYIKKEEPKTQQVNYVVVSNHGGKNTSTSDLLKSLNCNTVLISCKNSDSLPVDDLKKYLSDIQGFFYDTKNSNIEINSIKDSGVSVSTSVTPVDKDKIDTNYDRYESREEEIKTHKYVGNRNTYLFYDNTNPIVMIISGGNITYF